MPYFPVDDQITFHPKAVAAGNAAMGAWTRAGAWAKNHATGGFVSRDVAHAIGTKESKRLVAVGLWVIGAHPDFGDGYWFHDWEHVAGNFDGETEKARRDAKREADRERQRQKRDRDRESVASHSVTSRRLSSPSVPSPDLNDMTHPVPVSPEGDAGALGIDNALVTLIKEKTERATIAADRLGITDLPKIRQLLEHTVVAEMTLGGAVELAGALLGKATGEVRDVTAYLTTVCNRTPEKVQDAFFQLDIGAVA